MGLPRQTVALLRAARQLVDDLPADAVLLLPETALDYDEVRAALSGCRLIVVHPNGFHPLRGADAAAATLIEIDAEPAPTREKLAAALLKAITAGHVRQGGHIVALYNGIGVEGESRPEPLDSVSVIHLGEHLERLTAQDLRRLNTPIPLETLRLVIELATEIGREGRESHPVGTLLVVGDTRKVLSLARPINFNPFRGYSRSERDLRDRRVREQIKDIAQLDGALIIGRDGIAVAACMHLDARGDGISIQKGLGARHWAAASISRKTRAVAVVVSQSSGTVRVFQDGEVVLHIEPLARPHIWQPPRLEAQDENAGISSGRTDD